MTARRLSRTRRDREESLAGYWNRLEPPPEWASDPEHHDEILGLVFSMDGPQNVSDREHPHCAEWVAAFEACASRL